MNYEIRKVANGYLVRPAPSLAHGNYSVDSDMHVFETLTGTFAWLKDQYEPALTGMGAGMGTSSVKGITATC